MSKHPQKITKILSYKEQELIRNKRIHLITSILVFFLVTVLGVVFIYHLWEIGKWGILSYTVALLILFLIIRYPFWALVVFIATMRVKNKR